MTRRPVPVRLALSIPDSHLFVVAVSPLSMPTVVQDLARWQGAGAGAIIGDATGGNAGSGALIGAGLGALTGAAVGSEMDQLAAQNRAEIAAQLGQASFRLVAANIPEVIAMTQAGVDPRLILNYVRTSGVAQPLAANDVIYLHQQGVATEVIQALQTPTAQPVVGVASPTTCHRRRTLLWTTCLRPQSRLPLRLRSSIVGLAPASVFSVVK